MSLRLTYKAVNGVPVEVEGLLPEKVAGLPLSDVERLPVFCGNRRVSLAELFSVAGGTSDGQIDFELHRRNWIFLSSYFGSVLYSFSSG